MEYALNFLPKPKEVCFSSGRLSLENFYFSSDAQVEQLITDFFTHQIKQKITKANTLDANVAFKEAQGFSKEEYILEIMPERVIISYGQKPGLYYALITLKHIIHQFKENLPCLLIKDKPDIEVRGVMLDISRDKVPTLETLQRLIDMLSDLKINHFQLYIEGFSFAYPSFRHLWEGKETPITIEELQQLEKYCSDRFIDLVGNQNCLGHMEQWLAQEEYKELAENTESVKIMGVFDSPPTTINPSNPKSLALIQQMFEDILPCFSSDYFNANLDEPIMLGTGRSNAIEEGISAEDLYLQHVDWVYDLISSYKKKMLMWGDILIKDPKLVDKLPEDITVMLWGYEQDYPFDAYAKILSQSQKDFYLCPGTNAWLSLTGRTQNMLHHIQNACDAAQKHKAKGVVVTEWGDKGHWQHLPISYPAYVYAMGLSWNLADCSEADVSKHLNTYVFKDAKQLMGDIVLDYGRYNQFEEFPMFNMTLTMSSYTFGLQQDIVQLLHDRFGILDAEQKKEPMSISIHQRLKNKKTYAYDALVAYVKKLESQLEKVDLKSDDGALIIKEYKHATKMIVLGAMIRHYTLTHTDMTYTDRRQILQSIQTMLEEVRNEFKRLWGLRNKDGGLKRSMKELDQIQMEVNDQLAQ